MFLSSTLPGAGRCRAFSMALLLVAGFLFAPASAAEAASHGRHTPDVVIFGDSVVADPPVAEYLARRVERGSSQAEDGRFCPTSDDNFGVRAAAKLGLPAVDYSCTGATAAGTNSLFGGQRVTGQVDRAITEGDLTAATARVLISVGFNDTYTNLGTPADQLRSGFIGAMVPVIDGIRAAAPNARIQIVGYPTISEDGDFCLVNAGGSVRTRNHVSVLAHFEALAQDMQLELAQAAGVEFLDLKPSTTGRGMCAPDHLRNWAGVYDVNASPNNMPYHMNARGHEHVAEVVARS